MSDRSLPEQTRQPRRLMPRQAVRSSLVTTDHTLKPRLNSIAAACSSCRKHKIKCSGKRPVCQRCVDRRIPCVYTTRPGETVSQALSRSHNQLQSRATIYEELFDLLRTLPERDAQDVLRRIRSGSDVSAVVNHVMTGDILVQMAIMPETRLWYEFPYRSEMPRNLVSDNVYLDSLLYESTSVYSQSSRSNSLEVNASRANVGLGSEQNQSAYLKPFHAALVLEPWLSDVKVSRWTNVCADDVLMRDLLRVFFRCEYQFTAAFHKDLFLEDMATQRADFCSPLLANAVLAYACVCYPQFTNRAEYWNPQTLLYRFLAEAKRLWELEASEPRITTIQAGIVFAVVHNLCGVDQIGKAYRVHAVALANELRIFDMVDEQSDRLQHGRAFTAWTLYNWETLTAFSFMHLPLLLQPPAWSLPDASKDAVWYGEIWVEYPMDSSPSSTHFRHTFRAKCEFRIIMNEFCQAAYSPSHDMSLDKAYAFRERLRDWHDSLPQLLQPKAISGHIQLHIYYHHLLLSIYEPLCDASTIHQPSSEQIVADARRSLQTLVRLYYLRHGFEAMDLFIVTPLMLVAYDCVGTINEELTQSQLETVRSTLVLVVQGLFNQRRNHYLAVALFQVMRGRMRPQEVSLLKGVTSADQEEVDNDRGMPQPVRSHWPVSIVKKTDNVNAHILTNLVQNYALAGTKGEHAAIPRS